jgi:O-antigen ligase
LYHCLEVKKRIRQRRASRRFFAPNVYPLMKSILKRLFLPQAQSDRGQAALEFILPLVLLLVVLIAFAMVIPTLTPTRTLAFAGGVIIFVLSFVSTQIALYILIFSMLLSPEFIVGATEGATLGRGITLRVDDFIVAIIGFSWLARMAINKELGLFLKTPLNRPIAYYILACVTSTLFGAFFGRLELKTGFLYVLKYFEYVVIYFMVANYFKDRKQMKTFVWVMLLTCLIVSVISMTQIPQGERISAPFEGKVGEPNTYGGYLVFMMSIATGIALMEESFRDRLVAFFLVILFSIPLLYTQSRSSYLAAIPAVLSFLWLSKRKQWIPPVLLLVALLLPFMAPKVTKDRVSYTFTQGIGRPDTVTVAGVQLDTSTSARIQSWREAMRDLAQHPVLGFGVTGYRFVDAQYVRVAAETGFLGLLIFLLLLGTILRESYRVFRASDDPFDRGLVIGFIAGLTGLLFHAIGANTFIIVRIMEPFWFIAAMVMMIPTLEKDRRSEAAKAGGKG